METSRFGLLDEFTSTFRPNGGLSTFLEGICYWFLDGGSTFVEDGITFILIYS
jgi:hypothetical protein